MSNTHFANRTSACAQQAMRAWMCVRTRLCMFALGNAAQPHLASPILLAWPWLAQLSRAWRLRRRAVWNVAT
eukprot:11174552-Lingulodinium_polyedra.AAC.1